MKQLAEDDPPEVYETARRLDAGHDRHEVLHLLARRIASQIHATVTDHQPDDHARHVAGLRALPASGEPQRAQRKPGSAHRTDTGRVDANGADEALAHRLTSCRARSDGCTRAG